MKKILFVLFVAAAAVNVSAIAEEASGESKPYPLDTCVVSGEKLGEMGEPYVYQHEGREVRFCCKRCVKKFLKNPAAYLKKIDDAAAAKTTEP